MKITPMHDDRSADTLEWLLHKRHSCRAFRDRPVPDEKVARVLAMAQRTASWCNSQPWQVIVTAPAATDRLRMALFEHAKTAAAAFDIEPPSEYRGLYLQRRRECGFRMYESVGIAPGDREASGRQALENFRFFGAPHVAIVTTESALGPYGVLDCGAWVSNFILAATSLGVASIAQAALATQSQFLRDWFGIPYDRKVVCGVSFGYANEEHPVNAFRTGRAVQEEVVQWVRE